MNKRDQPRSSSERGMLFGGVSEKSAEITIFIGCEQDPQLQGHVIIRNDATTEELEVAIANHIRLPLPSFFITWNSQRLSRLAPLSSQGIVSFSTVHVFPIKAMQDKHKADQEKNKKDKAARYYVGRDGSVKVRRRDRQKAMEERLRKSDGDQDEEGKKGLPGFRQFCNAMGVSDEPRPRSSDPFRPPHLSSNKKRPRPADHDDFLFMGHEPVESHVSRHTEVTSVVPPAKREADGCRGPLTLPSRHLHPETVSSFPGVSSALPVFPRVSPGYIIQPNNHLPSPPRDDSATRRQVDVFSDFDDSQCELRDYDPPSYVQREEGMVPLTRTSTPYHYSSAQVRLSRERVFHSPSLYSTPSPSDPPIHITPPSPVNPPPSPVYKPPSPVYESLSQPPISRSSSSLVPVPVRRSVFPRIDHRTSDRPSSPRVLPDRPVTFCREDRSYPPTEWSHVSSLPLRSGERPRLPHGVYPTARDGRRSNFPISPPRSSSADTVDRYRTRDERYDLLPLRSISGLFPPAEWGRFWQVCTLGSSSRSHEELEATTGWQSGKGRGH
ncbi:hypothetical protein L198_06874 [Cryptococcus wingfieldii CBS 7118]|uniref:Uncharacterized protein n=1 Tax=Cryptococcus wingfieldii CBS 7118 TaxID=1295528 RepID=A0A1E3IHN3_9TREE|nr:hypothetical protein L198_06874 [Cryptococcus wingfieldii CBS 7118]ODN88110.1 hypothetical protein L198_06874 [Cryptococcus wingfieldii CBS 7118]